MNEEGAGMIVQEMRLQKGWSQQQLADISGLNVRTVQRIEQGQSASLESFKALGAAFNVDFSALQEDSVRNIVSTPEQTEVFLAFQQVRKMRGLYSHMMSYVIVMSGLAAINLILMPHRIWFIFPLLGWGVGLLSHAVSVLNILPWFGPEWEKRQVEKKLGRRL
jgi:transcriptional regulator with XRE-family HTH domain